MRYPNREELLRMGVTVFAVYLAIYYWDSISRGLGVLFGAFSPVLVGCIIAYIANIPMAFIEAQLEWMNEHNRLSRLRRPVSLLAGIVIVVLLAAFLLRMVVPELAQSMRVVSQTVPELIKLIRNVFREFDLEMLVDEELRELSDWDSIQVQLSEYLMSGAGGVMGSVLTGVSSVLSSTFEMFMSIILAIYILMGKERLASQMGTLVETYLGRDARARIAYVTGVVDRSFHSFIVSRFLVCLLLGGLCTVGMLLFGFPYAGAIGTLVGCTAIVPVVGPYVGALIGFLLVLTSSPLQAVLFLVYLIILEQIEANVIFPQLVGSTMGLPGIWVLAAVAVGGGLGGIPFVLVSVPVVSSVYTLLGDDLRARQAKGE